MSKKLRILFLGGSTMRGFSLDEPIIAYPKLLLESDYFEGEIYVKDLIKIDSVLQILASDLFFDILVIQIGVADSLRKSPKVIRNLRKKFFPVNVSGNNRYILKKETKPGFRPLKKFLKSLLFMIKFYKPSTSLSDFEKGVYQIIKLSCARGFQIVWLGTVLGSRHLTRIEINVKRSYCGEIFKNCAKNFGLNYIFIDVDHIFASYVNPKDIFHLNQEGHIQLANLLRKEISELNR